MEKIFISRRGFVAASGALTAAVLSTPAYSLTARPTLYGDGVHDDTDALEALFANRPLTVMNDRLTAAESNGTVRLLNGKFNIRRPLKLEDGVNLYSANCSFSVNGGPSAPYPILR